MTETSRPLSLLLESCALWYPVRVGKVRGSILWLTSPQSKQAVLTTPALSFPSVKTKARLTTRPSARGTFPRIVHRRNGTGPWWLGLVAPRMCSEQPGSSKKHSLGQCRIVREPPGHQAPCGPEPCALGRGPRSPPAPACECAPGLGSPLRWRPCWALPGWTGCPWDPALRRKLDPPSC